MTNREAIEYIKRMQEKFHSDKSHKACDMAIAALKKQERETQEKPFPFVVGQPAEMFIDGKWEKGKIVAGYRFNDGIVTIETEDGRTLWCGQDRTDICRPYQEDKVLEDLSPAQKKEYTKDDDYCSYGERWEEYEAD